jgi:hypothetical protein
MFDIHIVTLKVLMAVTIKIIIFGFLMQCSPIGHKKLLNYSVRSQITASFMFMFRSILSVLLCMNDEKAVVLLDSV